MPKLLILTLLTTLSLIGASAQVIESTDTPLAAPPPVSQKDLQGLEEKMGKRLDRLTQELEEARTNVKKAETRGEEARVQAQKAYEDKEREVTAAQMREKKAQDDAKAAQLARLREAQEYNRRLVIISVVVILSLLGLGVYFVRKNKTTRVIERVVIASPIVKEGEEIPEIIYEPNKPELKKALKYKPEQRVVFSVQEGPCDCVVVSHEEEPWIKEMNGEPVWIAWENRKKSAGKRSTNV